MDWNFYQITTTENGGTANTTWDADYPGNFGYNRDAFVFTLNMFAVGSQANHVQVVSVNSLELATGASQSQLNFYQNDLAGTFSVRPTTMHDAQPGDPMWLLAEHGDGTSIDVFKMTNVLSNSAVFTPTTLAVTPYTPIVQFVGPFPLNPDGSIITENIDSRIQKAAEANHTIVAAHSVAASPSQDVIQWYTINVSTGTPVLTQEGRVGAGNNTYLVYPAIDINSSGVIGMTYTRSGDDSPTDYMSAYVTGRLPSDAAGTMETPVLVPAGTGTVNDTLDGREGDLRGINVDQSDGSFWAAAEFATPSSFGDSWGTAIANFTVNPKGTGGADLSVTDSGPFSANEGDQGTYILIVNNNGPEDAGRVQLTDTLDANSKFTPPPRAWERSTTRATWSPSPRALWPPARASRRRLPSSTPRTAS
jgi:uncharacterized repeat protein (TIGR01451 family)